MLLLLLLALPDLPLEDELLQRARIGDQAAIAEIYEAFFDPIYQFIRWRVNDPGVAEDLTSDVFIKLLAALRGQHAPVQTLRGWLFRVARNVLHDHYHQTVAMDELDENFPAPYDTEVQLMRTLDAERVREAVRRLAPDQQEVLLLRFAQMLSLQDTAQAMGRSLNAVKSLQFRAINTLRQALAENQTEARYGST
ncbi:MAG TPA: sigma-70 family RNA polymerase sigma factor [Aggregatilineaceae bacterium]|nr:sigma-70 family RNA polymerase sigma factor [Aggregatilineaceae bacterium]